MKKRSLAVLATVLLAAPFAASAQFQLGAKLGYSIPMGDAVKDSKYTDGISAQIPIGFDLAWRFGNFSPGVYFDLAPSLLGKNLKDSCTGGVSCNALGLRFGIQGNWAFSPGEPMSPWVGARFGTETVAVVQDQGGQKATTAFGGYGFGVQGGLDFNFGILGVGPYVGLEMNKYTKVSTKLPGSSTETNSIPSGDQTWHQFLSFGARALLTF
jgi:hypothetical protein